MDVNLVLAVAVIMIAVGGSFLYMLLGHRQGWKPGDAMEWIGSILAVALIGAAVTLIGVGLKASEAPIGPAMVVTAGGSQPEIIDMALDAEAGNFTFRAVGSDEEVDLDGLQGKVVLVNFWATWCAPCLREIPELNRLAEKHADAGLVVLSLSDEDPQTLSNFAARVGLETFSAHVPMGSPLPAPFTKAFEVRPTSFVIDREGRVRRYMLGARSLEIFERYVSPYL